LAGGINYFTYVQGNPVNSKDPGGLWAAQVIGGGIGAAYGMYAAHESGTNLLQGFLIGGLTGVLSTIPIPGVHGAISGLLVGSLSGALSNLAGQATDPCAQDFDWGSLGYSVLAGGAGGALGGGVAGARANQVVRGPLLNSVVSRPILTPFGQDVVSASLGGVSAGWLDAVTH
jgi:hypothetical protein